MKPEFEQITTRADNSFNLRIIERENRKHLSQAWHFHPEIEICFTEISHGKRFVGNQISDYEEGDLVMFGSNLPHGFITDHYSKQIVIQFVPNFLGEAFIERPELNSFKKLLAQSKIGLSYYGKSKAKAIWLIKQLSHLDGFLQLVKLLELLEVLANTEEVLEICPDIYSVNFDSVSLNRMKTIYDFILTNLSKNISLADAAKALNMTESSFYKFIKKNTKKTFTQLLNEFRINHASKKIINTNKTIAQIAYECGYNNISYFNKRFKILMNNTPIQFRNKYQNN